MEFAKGLVSAYLLVSLIASFALAVLKPLWMGSAIILFVSSAMLLAAWYHHLKPKRTEQQARDRRK